EDGPTHQPVEQLASLRAMPNLLLLRPADANETVEAWRIAMRHTSGPVGLVLTRQKLPVLDRTTLAPSAGTARGAYVLIDAGEGLPELILIATGSEVSLALEAHRQLVSEGARDYSRNDAPRWPMTPKQTSTLAPTRHPAAKRRLPDGIVPEPARQRPQRFGVVHLAWEYLPLARTGGLGEAVSGLARFEA